MKRRHSDQDRQSPSDASSNESGADSAQNDTRRLRHSASPSIPPQQPIKKKRTRTLTTPHQSAALHALLAQSRFPTTAMREQVGRSIGLSARKVQVWFQNQRQKARRPRDSKIQGSPAAPAHPPQYGAFPNVPAAPFLHSAPPDHQQQHQPANTSTTTGLSGPGVPGGPPNPGRFPQQGSSSSSARITTSTSGMPSTEFTFTHPFPPLHLQVPEQPSSQNLNQYPTMIPIRPLTVGGRPRSQYTTSSSSSSPTSPPSPYASVSESRPQTPVSSFLVPRHRDLPPLRIPPLHVPESPHTNTHTNNTTSHAHARVHIHVHVQHQSQRSALPLPPYSPPPLSLPPPPLPQDQTRFSRPLPSLFHSTGRGGEPEISPVPAHATATASTSVSSTTSRAKRFDPVREAASECSRSGSLGTESLSTGTPPRIDTPKRLTTSF